MSTNNDGSESVDQFLARIASIREGKSDPNAASRRMDEEFLKGRQERQARRLERARSISPSKTGPARPLSSATNAFDAAPTAEQALNSPVDFSSQAKSLSRANAVSGRTSPARDLESVTSRPLSLSSKPDDAQPTASGLARSGTLSWQQRPTQRDGPRQRPLSVFATVRSTSKEPEEETGKEDLTRSEIAASLASKDPTWFRQTQDRGVSSAAYRKNQVEEVSEPLSSKSMQLPGMARSREPSKSPVPESMGTVTMPQKTLIDRNSSPRVARGTTPDIAALRESIAEKPASLRPSSQDTFSSRPTSTDTFGMDESTTTLARSSSSLAQNRPASPTKGLGGFVESAMMKRSDSVNKRWSVKSTTGLVRGDSVAGARPRSLHSRGLSRDIPLTRGESPSSPLASSRPGSGHGQPSTSSPQVSEKSKIDATQDREVIESRTPPVLKSNSRPQTPTEDAVLARSPSKTMDQRRWSPTKSTWLETALQQQAEPPKLQPLKEELPKWKVDLQRSKSRASRDVSPDKSRTMQPEGTLQKILNTSGTAVKSSPAEAVPLTKPQTLVAVSQPEPPISTQSIDVKSSEQDFASTAMPEPVTEKTASQAAQTSEAFVQKDVSAIPKQAPALKPKPQTPPKTDFRATLKSRTAGPTQANDSEPEFKSMFGKLKRTTTQNYVAPDELKTNILTGKAALNTTGGPVKTKRVDEFKESILAKKEEMKTTGVKPGSIIESKPRSEDPVPEALARRKTLSKASAPDLSSLRKKPDVKPELPVKSATIKSTDSGTSRAVDLMPPTAMKAETPTKPPILRASTASPDAKPVSKAAEDATFSSSTSQTNVDSTTPLLKTKSLPATKSSTQNQPLFETKSPGTSQESKTFPIAEFQKPPAASTTPVASKLASRLNPNLAAMLSRGPSPKPAPSSKEETKDSEKSQTQGSTQKAASIEDSTLTHMTKGRAKGPKRRAPKAEAREEPKASVKTESKAEAQIDAQAQTRVAFKAESSTEASKPIIEPTMAVSKAASTGRTLPLTPKSKSTSTALARESKTNVSGMETLRGQDSPFVKKLQQPSATAQSESDTGSSQKSDVVQEDRVAVSAADKARPPIASKSPELRRVSGTPTTNARLSSDSKPATPPKPLSVVVTPKAKAVPEGDELLVNKPEKAKTDSATPTKETLKSTSKPNSTTPRPKSTVVQGLGLQMSPSPKAVQLPVRSQELTPPPDEDIKVHKNRQNINIKSLLESYVGAFPNEYERADFNAQQFLTGVSVKNDKIKTLQHSIIEVSGDGKRSEMPSHHQPVLCEESMYLITHKFSTNNGTVASEVQLWCGDRVADAAVDDAQIFCRRTAREHNVKLEVVKQGKESFRFISGLGGILIIRRTKSSASYMLCGRQHLGHIVFDEVDMRPENLCPALVYLVSAPHGKLFLWKGKGAGIDEISSAKLTGTDLAGEIEEVEQGKETSLFWEAIGKPQATQFSKDWQNQGSGKAGQTSLYRVDHERPGMLTNLASWGLKRAASPAKQQTKVACEHVQPFTQNDLDHPSIHILDAYHSLYILVTRQCASKAAEFLTSMHLAQEFAMLSPAIQDRPTLPTCYVVAGEFPQDVKMCFRKWSNIEGSSMLGQGSLCVRLEEVMEAIDL